MVCDFVIQLSRLRKLSAESVENTNHFDPFKEYLHVVRPVEMELRELLRNANVKQKKCLILLCGSAGDGKSHLISYLKNSDPEGLLTDYEPYNDATESSEPTLTSIDTLSEKLASFNDDNYLLNDGKKMIVAINLGTLNNFIESDKGKNFSKLKEYVENNGIFSGYGQGSTYIENSVFQHVSFSDYQVFSLSESGVETLFLEKLLDRIFVKSVDNPFYKAYMDDESCSLCQRCPVRHNFEFLSDSMNQKALIRRIVEVVIKDKAIVSTREVLNLLFDLIVHPDFDKKRISIGTSDIKYLTDYINWTTPMLLDEYEDISSFLNFIRKHDALKTRSNASDDAATRFHSLENIHEVFEKATQDTPYQILNNLTDISVLGGIKIELKKIIYRFMVRLNAFRNNSAAANQSRLEEFIRYLYYQNCGNEKKLAELYTATKKAVLCWDGQFEDDCICIDDTNSQLWIVEQLQLKSAINKHTVPTAMSIQRFSPTLRLRFKRESLSMPETAEISIDFSLYELISDMKEGYSLAAAMDKLYQFQIFESNPSQTVSLYDLLKGVVVIDLSGYDADIQSLIVAITLDLFYSQMQASGSSKLDGHYRQLSKLILVDEADNFMSEGFPAMKKIMKEGREFGVGMILSTQFLKHFGSGEDDYSKYILTWVVHNVADLKVSDVEFVFKTEPKSAESQTLYNDIKGLKKHHSIIKIGNEKPVYIEDKAFWELYKDLKLN